MNKAIFLDRDGVINDLVYFKEDGFIDSPFTEKQFKIIKGVPESIKKMKSLGFKIIIISNQPGIAKAHFSEKTFEKICLKLKNTLKQENTIIDGEYYCLHHPEAKIKKYKKVCSCRKPKIGLISKAVKIHKINLKKSYLIGDGIVDLEVAKKAKCKSIFVGNINSTLTRMLKQKKLEPDFIVHDLREAVDVLEK